jgi:hypothetical protein
MDKWIKTKGSRHYEIQSEKSILQKKYLKWFVNDRLLFFYPSFFENQGMLSSFIFCMNSAG